MRIQIQSAKYPAWAIWLIGVPLAIGAALLAAFFLTFFIILFVLALAMAALRIWWRRRKQRHGRPSRVIEGEYSVVRESKRSPGSQPQ